MKGTFGLLQGFRATLSHHLGDLDHYRAYRSFESDLSLYERTFELAPKWLAHDLHPDYASTRYAIERAARQNIELIAVQHHHAHLASCMAEHGITEPVIGVCFDGTGYGLDGAIWGGEFLIGDYERFIRAAHLRYVALPGGDRAVKEPWRVAVSHLRDAGVRCQALMDRIDPAALRIVERMLEGRINTAWTSSVGRLFDAVAALAGVRQNVTFEGQAAIELEWLAGQAVQDEVYPFELTQGEPCVIDTRPLIRAVAEDVGVKVPTALVARRFHFTMAKIVAEVCERIRRVHKISSVALASRSRLACDRRYQGRRSRQGGSTLHHHRRNWARACGVESIHPKCPAR